MRTMTTHKTVVATLAVLTALALPMVAGAADKLKVQDASSHDKFVVTDTSSVAIVKDASGNSKIVMTDSGKIGINTTPIYQFHLVGTGDPSTGAAIFDMPGRATGYLPTDSAGFSFMRNNDVSINSGLPNANDRLGYFGFGTKIGTGYKWLSFVSVFAEANATSTSAPTYMSFFTTAQNFIGSAERMRITSAGNVGIGTTAPKSKLHVTGIVEYADNAAAAAGLTAGAIYRTGDVLKIVH